MPYNVLYSNQKINNDTFNINNTAITERMPNDHQVNKDTQYAQSHTSLELSIFVGLCIRCILTPRANKTVPKTPFQSHQSLGRALKVLK